MVGVQSRRAREPRASLLPPTLGLRDTATTARLTRAKKALAEARLVARSGCRGRPSERTASRSCPPVSQACSRSLTARGAAAISGLHSSANSFAATEWARIVSLYAALERVWPSPAVTVARLSATMHEVLSREEPAAQARELSHVEEELLRLEASSAAYATRDASLALADLTWRTGRREEAAARYRDLAEVMAVEPLRRFCLRRAAG